MMKKVLPLLVLGLTPVFVGAQDTAWIDSLGGGILAILTILVPVLTGLGLVVFIWGMALFIAQSDNDEARKKGKLRMIWGLVGLFVMVSVWGIVALITQISGVTIGPVVAPRAGVL